MNERNIKNNTRDWHGHHTDENSTHWKHALQDERNKREMERITENTNNNEIVPNTPNSRSNEIFNLDVWETNVNQLKTCLYNGELEIVV